uniref:Uncharacterized protein n=1 Tax=Nymphaea colorata TaxID=210225 RepID=A0A5K1G6R1_9MAGN
MFYGPLGHMLFVVSQPHAAAVALLHLSQPLLSLSAAATIFVLTQPQSLFFLAASSSSRSRSNHLRPHATRLTQPQSRSPLRPHAAAALFVLTKPQVLLPRVPHSAAALWSLGTLSSSLSVGSAVPRRSKKKGRKNGAV